MSDSSDSPGRSRSRRQGHGHGSGSGSGSSSNSGTASTPPTYGYHNTFHTHAQLVADSPPSYACATSPRTLKALDARAAAEALATRQHPAPPAYTCSVALAGVLGVKQELASPFQLAGNRQWDDVYVVLQGTRLGLHRIKSPHFLSKTRQPGPGRLLRSYTLQHAEVGIASDFKKTRLTPKSPFAHLVPAQARQRLYETDPHLFEPVREHAIRLRLETQQFLLCASSQEEMLDWVEALCQAIDISPPIDDRCEPRYRSLPRRTRRQRLLDGSRLAGQLDSLSNLEAGRRIIAEQERIIRQLYPHLAGSTATAAAAAATATATATESDAHEPAAHLQAHSQAVDAELEDFDPDDVRFPTRRPLSATSRDDRDDRPDSSATNSSDPKSAAPFRHTPSQALRYRRRCAPVLLASSPRVSDVVYMVGDRMRINVKEHSLGEYHSHPPRYEAHNFPKKAPKTKDESSQAVPPPITTTTVTASKPLPTAAELERPASPLRGISDDSLSFGYDLASTSSDPPSGDSSSNGLSEPPSPTALTQAKADAARHQLAMLGKRRSSEDRDTGLSAVALGAGLLI